MENKKKRKYEGRKKGNEGKRVDKERRKAWIIQERKNIKKFSDNTEFKTKRKENTKEGKGIGYK